MMLITRDGRPIIMKIHGKSSSTFLRVHFTVRLHFAVSEIMELLALRMRVSAAARLASG